MSMTNSELAARRDHLDEQIKRLTDERDQINDLIRENNGMGNNEAGDWTIQLQVNRQLDKARFMQRFPVAQYPHFYQPTVDSAAIKQFIAPAELGAFYNEGTPKIAVK